MGKASGRFHIRGREAEETTVVVERRPGSGSRGLLGVVVRVAADRRQRVGCEEVGVGERDRRRSAPGGEGGGLGPRGAWRDRGPEPAVEGRVGGLRPEEQAAGGRGRRGRMAPSRSRAGGGGGDWRG